MYFSNEPSRGLYDRLIRRVSSCAILIACLWLPPAPHVACAADGDAGTAAVGPLAPATTQESRVAGLARLMDRLSECAREQSRDGFDYQAVIESVGRDPVKLAKWVKENTRLVPYSGLLRGPQGVLMDRVGNDLDRALLLAQLVNSSGYECRLARAILADDEAAVLIASAALTPLPGMAGGKPSESYLAMDAAVDKQTKVLMALVAPAIDMAKIGQSLDASRLADAKDHWWIQYNPAGKWIDLDPDSDGKPSGRLGREKPVFFACTTNDLAGKIPAELFHSVTFKVVIERWKDGKLEEEAAIETAMKTWDHPSDHVVLYHRVDDKKAKAQGSAQVENLSDLKEPVAIKAALLKHHGWRPLLVVNERAKGSKAFDETGTLYAPEGGAAQVGSGVRNAFGNALNTGAAPPPPQSVLTAEWMDLTLTRPGHPPVKLRREVFDSIGPALRALATKGPIPKPVYDESHQVDRAGALSGWTNHQVATSTVPWEYVFHNNCRKLLDRRTAILRAASDPPGTDNGRFLKSLASGDQLSLFNFYRAIQPDHVTYQDRPNVFSCNMRWQSGADGVCRAIYESDLAINSVAATGSSPSDAFAACVHRGVADTCLEALIVGRNPHGMPTTRPADAPEKDPSPKSTPEIFSLAMAQGIQPILIKQVSDPALTGMQISDDVRQRIASELSAGKVIVVPAKPVMVSGMQRTAWWRIDAANGLTVGVLDDGRCGEVETGIQEAVVVDGAEDTVLFRMPEEGFKSAFRRRSLEALEHAGVRPTSPEGLNIMTKIYDSLMTMSLR